MVRTKASIKKSIKEIIEYMKKKGITVNLGVLFGSYVSGSPTESSDVDLAIFSKDLVGKRLKKRVELASEISLHCGNGMELHLYPIKSLSKARPTNFVGYILKNGKHIYKEGKYLNW
jgi:predicted nucleotidyltransferase